MEQRKKKIRLSWVTWGLILSVLAASGYMACYGLFRSAGETVALENPLEKPGTANMLMWQTYVLYHDLQQRQSPETLSYTEVYVKPKPGCEWVLDKNLRNHYLEGEEVSVTVENASEIPEDGGSIYRYLRALEDFFEELEQQFSDQVSYNFDYSCEDLETGVSFSNAEQGSIDSGGKYFYLALLFDEYGNCTLKEDIKFGKDASLMRKYVNDAQRTVSLESEELYKQANEAVNLELDTYFTLGRPTNCRIVYSITNADWQKYEKGETGIFLNGQLYEAGKEKFNIYRSNWIRNIFIALSVILLCLAIWMPLAVKLETATPIEQGQDVSEKPACRLLRLSPEILLAVGYIGSLIGWESYFEILLNTLDGTAFQSIGGVLGMPADGAGVYLLVNGLNFTVLCLLFFFHWFLGVNLREARRLGLREYMRLRSLVFRILRLLRSGTKRVYDSMVQMDLTKNADRMIRRLVLINGLILFVGCAVWIGGWPFAALYSVFLYLFLRRYVSDLQKKYARLLRATNEIAEGNLNIQIREDLGVFEPFKPQIIRIQEGFKRAVEEEVKSQRMKAELITNVSHDLKTPLTAIITYIDLLKEDNITEEQRREYLDTLERKSLRLKALIEDLFEVSKANSQNMTLNLADVDIMNLVKQVAFEMGDKLAERRLDLRMALSEEKLVLSLDPQRTYRIYENLFANIAKYAMPGTRVYVNGFCTENTVMIMLKNIAEEEISVKSEELAERFVRGDISRNTEGSGLGLAIAKSFTELQGGELEIEIDGDLFKVTTVWKA